MKLNYNSLTFDIFRRADFDYLTVKLYFLPTFSFEEYRANEYDSSSSRTIEFSAPTVMEATYAANELDRENNEYFYCVVRVLGIGFSIVRQKGY